VTNAAAPDEAIWYPPRCTASWLRSPGFCRDRPRLP